MKEVYIKFMAPVNPQSSDYLMRIVDDKIRCGYDKLHLLISSPGGSVFHGLSLYNFLYGCPIIVDTYNFGSVDSIGIVLFCAGKRRFSVPNARFLIHGVSMNIQGGNFISLDEKSLEDHLKNVRIDQSNIIRIIATTTKKSEDDIKKIMHERTAFTPDQARSFGLVTDLTDKLMPMNVEFYSIGEFDSLQPAPQQVMPFQM